MYMATHINGKNLDDESLWPVYAACEKIKAAAKANGRVACHHGAGPAVSAKFVQMGSMLCQIGNDVRMLSAATAEALKTFREAMA